MNCDPRVNSLRRLKFTCMFCRPPSATTTSNPNPKRVEKDEPPQEYVVVLADPHLMEMPLEALKCFQVEPVVSLSREISLQMLHHKNHVEPLDEAAEKAKKEKDKNKPPSRLPGLRDANKKLAKIVCTKQTLNKHIYTAIFYIYISRCVYQYLLTIPFQIPLDRQIPPGSQPIDTHAFRCILSKYT